MKTRLFPLVLALCCICLWSSATATVKVTDIYLQKSSQFTEVTLVCDGATEFTHQIVEATASKPYRIVVDVKNAVPGLSQLAYKNLPSGSIKQIRTSQFSTDPEKVVRIVLDVAGTLTYKVKGDGNTFTLQINTPSDKDFPKWSAVTGSLAPTLATTKTAVPSKSEAAKKTETPVKAEVDSKPEVAKKTETPAKTELASKPEETKKAETPAKTEVASKPEVAKKTETPAKTQTAAITQAPKTMPAHPDNSVTSPKRSSSEVEKKDLKLAAKPIDESKLLTKVNKSAATTKTEEKAQPSTVAEVSATSDKLTVAQTKATPSPTPKVIQSVKLEAKPKAVDNTAANSDKVAKPSGTTTSTSAPSTEAPAAKRADSATMPQLKPTQSAPATEPVDMAKPPKSQKTALPETKVVKTPKYTESPEAGNALTGKIATASDGNKVTTTVSKPESGKDSTAAAAMSRSESVRMRYLAGKEKGITPAEATTDNLATAYAATPQTPPTEIEKIRTKYKRGIRFVQNDQDEQQQNTSETDQPQEADHYSGNVGAYNEFLPEREIVVYQTSGHPDPFMPLIEDATSKATGGELPDVETLRLVGILQDKHVSRALFEDYNNYSYILRTGDRVKNGFVLSIEETRVLFQIRQYGWNRQVAIDLENEK